MDACKLALTMPGPPVARGGGDRPPLGTMSPHRCMVNCNSRSNALGKPRPRRRGFLISVTAGRAAFCGATGAAGAIRSCAAASGRDSHRQIQAKGPLRRVEVLKEIVDVRDPGEGGADLLDATKRGLHFS